jgi:hypothetical protein
MQIISLIISLLIVHSLSGQECSIAYKYAERKAEYDPRLIELINQADTSTTHGTSKVAFVKYSLDTLNKESLVLTKFIGPGPQRIIQDLAGVYSYVFEDTMFIEMGYILGNEDILHKIYEDQVEITFTDWHKYDSNLKLNTGADPSKSITVPAIVEVFDTCEAEGMLWGYVRFTTAPYYKRDRYNSEQFIHIRWNYEYYFKLPLK